MFDIYKVFEIQFFSLSNAQSGTMNPCTPYCPGVNGFPELECTGCQSLFHSKCVGISPVLLPRLMPTWKCRVSIKIIQIRISY